MTVARPGVGDAVFMTDSRGVLVALDPRGASLVTPPATLWELAGGYYPTVYREPSGVARMIAARSKNIATKLEKWSRCGFTSFMPASLQGVLFSFLL